MRRNRPKYTQIIDAAVQVIAENGYHASQVSKIASKAGVADGTIYLYFQNKEDILISLFEVKMGDFINKIDQKIATKETANEQLYTLIKMHFQQFSNNHHLAIVTQLELRQSKNELRREINQVLKSYLNVIDRIIQEGISENIYQNTLNLPLVRQMIFGTIDEVVTNWVMKERKYDLVALAPDVHAFITRGISVENK